MDARVDTDAGTPPLPNRVVLGGCQAQPRLDVQHLLLWVWGGVPGRSRLALIVFKQIKVAHR